MVPISDLTGVLRQFNPWWGGGVVPDIPAWRRAVFPELLGWLRTPQVSRAILLTGARQVGKTTLLLQAAQQLIADGVPASHILYATFDHPLLKLAGAETVLKAWLELTPRTSSTRFLLLDEIQHTADWQTWIKHLVDFQRNFRLAVTGSAMPLVAHNQESGMGRWHTIRLPTLSFYEYLQIKQVPSPPLPSPPSLVEVFGWSDAERRRVGLEAEPLVAHFHEYLLRGGFPQTAQVQSIPVAQKLLREDIVDKALKRDMTALYGVRRILELERVFLYLCLHDGGILDMQMLSSSLGLKKATAANFIDLLEASNLIYRLAPLGYGKEILRARYKIYLADPAIAGSVMLRGQSLLDDPTRLGAAVETALFKHVFTHYYISSAGFSYWRGKRDIEVDIVAQLGDRLVPFEVRYRGGQTRSDATAGLRALHAQRGFSRGYLVTRDLAEFGIIDLADPTLAPQGPADRAQVLKLPAPLACFWLSRIEHEKTNPRELG